MWSAVIVWSTGNPASHAHEEYLIHHKITNPCFAKKNLGGCNYLKSPSDKSAIVVWFQLLSKRSQAICPYCLFSGSLLLRTWLRRKSCFCRVCVWTKKKGLTLWGTSCCHVRSGNFITQCTATMYWFYSVFQRNKMQQQAGYTCFLFHFRLAAWTLINVWQSFTHTFCFAKFHSKIKVKKNAGYFR